MKKAIFLCLISVFILTGCAGKAKNSFKPLKPADAQAKIMSYIDTVLSKNSTKAKATVTNIVAESGLYKISLKIEDTSVTPPTSTDVDIYSSLDGKKLFLRDVPLDVEAELAKLNTPDQTQAAANNQQAPVAEVTNKTDKPVVKLFVMANCPYGLQMERGVLPAITALGKKVDFQLEFCDYAMHGEAEVKEELNQTCIANNEPSKLFAYLQCYWKDSKNATDASACLTEAKINVSKMNSCVKTTDSKYNVTKDMADKNTWIKNSAGAPTFPTFNVFTDNTKYGVKGSPTLVINDQTISGGRDSASILKTICSAFKTQPKECETALSSAQPAVSFDSANAGASASNANCGN